MSGLDPIARIEMRELVRKLKGLGKTVMISSHILPELASVCDEVGIIEKAKLLAIGPIKKILAEVRQTRQVQIQLLRGADQAAAVLENVEGVGNLKVVENLVQFEYNGDDAHAAKLFRLLYEKNCAVCWMNEVEADLEEVFIQVTGRAANANAAGAAS